MQDIPRPKQHLVTAGKLYPGAWRQYDAFRQDRGRGGLPDWPDWCYCPLAGAYAIVSGGGEARVPTQIVGDVARLGALAAWRATQGIYRFDDALRAHLLDTPLTGELPCDVLHRLPEWCVYIETPGNVVARQEMYGFFAHLEHDANTGREELRLLLDCDEALVPMPIHLGKWSLGEAVARALDVSRVHALATGMEIPGSAQRDLSETAAPLVSLLLYLCADEAEIGDGKVQPTRPVPKRTKHGWRLFAAEKPSVWDVGVRLGAALRRAQAAQQIEVSKESGTHARPRAHIRRAHWHTFLSGAGRTDRRLKWLPPIPVNVDSPDELPAVIRDVKS